MTRVNLTAIKSLGLIFAVLSFLLLCFNTSLAYVPNGMYSASNSTIYQGNTNPTDDTWSADMIYQQGDEVVYNGVRYRAKWYTRGDRPDQNSGPDDVWAVVKEDISSEWKADTVYNQGDVVTYDDIYYRAKRYTLGERPDQNSGPNGAWEELDLSLEWSADNTYNTGDEVTYNGVRYRAKYWTKGDRPDLNNGNGKPWEIVEEPQSDEWSAVIEYNQGDIVTYNNKFYRARRTTLDERPDQNSGPNGAWEEFDPHLEWSADKIYNTGDEVTYNGVRYRAQWYNTNQRPDLNSGPYQVWQVV